MDVEGMGRVCTRKLAKAHSKTRCHDGFARAVVLELPLLQPWQHKTLRPVALRPRLKAAQPRFLSLTASHERQSYRRTLIRVSFTRVSARFAVRSPDFLEGTILDRRAGGPNAAQPELITVSSHYIRPESSNSKRGCG
jgi:hypothetical protein